MGGDHATTGPQVEGTLVLVTDSGTEAHVYYEVIGRTCKKIVVFYLACLPVNYPILPSPQVCTMYVKFMYSLAVRPLIIMKCVYDTSNFVLMPIPR